MSKAHIQQLRDILNEAGPMYQMHNPSTWARQAKLAASKKWVELEKLQKKLDGGVSKKTIARTKKISVKKAPVKKKAVKKIVKETVTYE